MRAAQSLNTERAELCVRKRAPALRCQRLSCAPLVLTRGLACPTGYTNQPHLPFLNATNTKRPKTVPDPATYVKEHFPKLDRFLGCRVEINEETGSDPNHPAKHDEL